ncbi:MAG: 3-phosphoshikimate 1-carboxyvinyltransferase [Ilumatobacteraceae bacterium]
MNASPRGFATPNGPLSGIVEVPGSKSLSNRALVCAALATGVSHIDGVALGDDTEAMIAALRQLGADITVAGTKVTVHRGIDRTSTDHVHVDARLAGTTARFLLALATLRAGATTIDGREPLRRRPMGAIADAAESLGARLTWLGERDRLPVRVTPRVGSGASLVRMRADESSQFVSAVLMAAGGGAPVREIEVDGDVVSGGYLAMTTAVMATFGVAVRTAGSRFVVSDDHFVAADTTIEADIASASYPLAAVMIAGGVVRIPRMIESRVQPEVGVLAVLRDMGGSFEWGRDGLTMTRQPNAVVRGVDVSMAEFSDLVPTVAVIAACASGPTTIRGVGFIRAKESDRLGDLAAELGKCAIDSRVDPDGLSIVSAGVQAAVLDTHHDHRLAMALALLGLRTRGVFVADPEVVAKSWPTYWDAMSALAEVRSHPSANDAVN